MSVSIGSTQATATSTTSSSKIPSPLSQHRSWRTRGVDFMLGGTATMMACVFTNPLELVKGRMQVQGEAALGKTTKVYKNSLDALIQIARHEGIRGIQGGLFPACLYQLTMNGVRLGCYDSVKRHIEKANFSYMTPWSTSLVSGFLTGVSGAFVGSPFFLIKVRLQIQNRAAAASGAGASVGVQHQHSGTFSGLSEIYRADGIRGLWRGCSAAMMRVGVGSAVQLSSYDLSKRVVQRYTQVQDGILLHFGASLVSSFIVCCFMTPPDVITTRLYNQKVVNGKGVMYSSLLDCAQKTVKGEGIRGLYKGFAAHYARIGPHTILTFIFWEALKRHARQQGWNTA